MKCQERTWQCLAFTILTMLVVADAASQELRLRKFLQSSASGFSGHNQPQEANQEGKQEPREETAEESKESKEDETQESKESEEEKKEESPMPEPKTTADGDTMAEESEPKLSRKQKRMLFNGTEKEKIVETEEIVKEVEGATTEDESVAAKMKEAKERLFDAPARKKEEKLEEERFDHEHEGENKEELFYIEAEGHAFGEEEHGHGSHDGAHPIGEPIGPQFIFLLFFTPILVLTSFTYFFFVAQVDAPKQRMNASVTSKMHGDLDGWRLVCGKIMEHPLVNASVLGAILVDLICATVHDVIVQTDLLNPKYAKAGHDISHLLHKISMNILCAFVFEQIIHIIVFGRMFFHHFWYVWDLIVVYVSLLGETVLNNKFGDAVQFLIAMRLWKASAFVFDIFLAERETREMHEKIEHHKKKVTGFNFSLARD